MGHRGVCRLGFSKVTICDLKLFPNVVMDSLVIMPNHIHLIVSFVGAGLGPPDKLDSPAAPKGAASRAPT